MEKFERRIVSWLSDDPNWLERRLNTFWFVWHHRVPRSFRFLGLLHWFTRCAAIVSAPALAYFVYERISLTKAIYASVILLCIFFATSLLDKWSKSRKGKTDRVSAETWVRVGDLITSVKSSATPAAKRHETIIAALGVIEAYAREITTSSKGEISVNLALYEDESNTTMSIRHRNPGNERPTGRSLKNLERVLGHIACQDGPEPRVVSDLKKFGKEIFFSPTQSAFQYRSMMLLPLKGLNANKIIGFLSIDCDRPYAFNGSRAERLVVTCEPLTTHIEEQY